MSGHDKKQFVTRHMIAEVNLAADTVLLYADMEEKKNKDGNKATDYYDFWFIWKVISSSYSDHILCDSLSKYVFNVSYMVPSNSDGAPNY